MGITIGIDNVGLSVALGGSDTKVDDYLGRRPTELGKYGISNRLPVNPFFAQPAHSQAETTQQESLARNLFYAVRS
jgi:hypothetical protein